MPAGDQTFAEINRTLGSLTHAIQTLEIGTRSHHEASEEGRRRLYEKVETLSNNVNSEVRIIVGTMSAITSRLDHVDKRLTAIEPTVELFERDQILREGAAGRGQKAWSWIAWGGAIVGWFAHELGPYISSVLGRGAPPHA